MERERCWNFPRFMGIVQKQNGIYSSNLWKPVKADSGFSLTENFRWPKQISIFFFKIFNNSLYFLSLIIFFYSFLNRSCKWFPIPGTHQLLEVPGYYSQFKDAQHNSALKNQANLLNIGLFLVFSVASGSLHEERAVCFAKNSNITNVPLSKKIKKKSLQHFLFDFPTSWPPLLFLLA